MVLLQDTSNDRFELWQKNDHFAGYVIEIDGVGYEFISGREPTQFDDPRHQIFGIKTVRGRREFITAEDIKKKQRGKG